VAEASGSAVRDTTTERERAGARGAGCMGGARMRMMPCIIPP
jgi:hypothetical protein